MSEAPYTDVNDTWPKYEKRWWVMVPDGRVGRVDSWVREHSKKSYLIRFGSGGPFEWHYHDDLRLATKRQYRIYGDGVG